MSINTSAPDRPTILLVGGDNEKNTDLRAWLAGHYSVIEAASVNDALTEFEPKQLGAVLIDAGSTGERLLGWLSALRARGFGAPAVVLCDLLSPSAYEHARTLGTVRLMDRSCSQELLLDGMRHALECVSGAFGSVHGLSLVDVLQMLHFARRTIWIEIHGAVRGQIEMSAGEVIYAARGRSEGMAALLPLLAQEPVILTTTPARGMSGNLNMPFESLILDAMRRIDKGRMLGDETLVEAGPSTVDHSRKVPQVEADFGAIVKDTIVRYCPRAGVFLMSSSGALVTLAAGESDVGGANLETFAEEAAQFPSGWHWVERMTSSNAAAALNIDNDELVVIYMPMRDKASSGRFRSAVLRAQEALRKVRPLASADVAPISATPTLRPPTELPAVSKACEQLVSSESNSALACRLWDTNGQCYVGISPRNESGVPEHSWALARALVYGRVGAAISKLSGVTDAPHSVEVIVDTGDFFVLGRSIGQGTKTLLLATSRQINLGMLALQLRTHLMKPFLKLDNNPRLFELDNTA